MTYVTISAILDAIAAVMETVTSITVQSKTSLTESLSDYPIVQVWPGGGGMTDSSKQTSTQTSYKGGLKIFEQTVFVDLYSTQRAFIGQDMTNLVTYIDAIAAILNAQGSPAFGLEHVRLASWSWDYFSEKFGDITQVGARFTIRILNY